MRNLEILILILSALFCRNHCEEEQSNKDWELFKIKYGKNYSQEPKRKHIWEQNKKIVKSHSKKDKSFQVKLNKFSDLTNDEFRKLMNGFKPNRTQFIRSFYDDDDESNFMIRRFDDFDLRSLPKFVDYRTKGYVTSGFSKHFYIFFI